MKTAKLTVIFVLTASIVLAILISSGCSNQEKQDLELQTPDETTDTQTADDSIFDLGETDSTDEEVVDELPPDEIADKTETTPIENPNEARKLSPENLEESKSSTRTKSAVDTEKLHRVVVSSFDTKPNAEKMLKMMVDEGYEAFIKSTEQDGKNLYYVQIGVFESKANADALVDELSKKGYKASIVHFE